MSSPVDAPDDPADDPGTQAGDSESDSAASDSPTTPTACASGAQSQNERIDTFGLAAAIDQLRVERRRLSDERAAFRSFADRLLEADPALRTRAIEDHYRETVMSVPHYDREYGESFERSVAAELGSTIAFDCRCGGSLEAEAVERIRAAAQQCWRRRDDLLDRIDAERHAVETAAEELAALREQLETLPVSGSQSRPARSGVAGSRPARSEPARSRGPKDTPTDSALRLRLAALRERCDDLTRRRRATLEAGSSSDGDEDDELPGDALQSLCYHDLETDRPVLAAIETLRRAIDRHRRRVLGHNSKGC